MDRHIQTGLLDKQMKANTMAAAAVLPRPDKTVQPLKKARFVSVLSPSLLCLSSNDPSSFSHCKHVHTSNPAHDPAAASRPLCLRRSHRRAVAECGAHGPECINGLWRDAAAAERGWLCVNSCSLATPCIKKKKGPGSYRLGDARCLLFTQTQYLESLYSMGF